MPFTLAAVTSLNHVNNVVSEFLAHLWGAYAIPVATGAGDHNVG